ncbi:hypothetical protein ACS0TY_020826 [Phlomoides rotata]
MAYPEGIIEDVLIKVDKFIFPVDFVVLEMKEDESVPLILGRPFLAIGGAVIDVKKGELVLNVEDDHVLFKIYKARKPIEAKDLGIDKNAKFGGVFFENSPNSSKLPSASGGVNKMPNSYDMIEDPDGLACGYFNVFKKGGSKKFQNKERDGITLKKRELVRHEDSKNSTSWEATQGFIAFLVVNFA